MKYTLHSRYCYRHVDTHSMAVQCIIIHLGYIGLGSVTVQIVF